MKRSYLRKGQWKHPGLSNPNQGGSSPDAAKIEASYIGFGTLLNKRFGRPDTLWRNFTKHFESNDTITRQMWLDSVPKMRLWEGDKVTSMLRAEALLIATRPHEASIRIPKQDIINDRWGLWSDGVAGLGDSYNNHLDEVTAGMLVAGVAGTALGTTYDGQNLIDTDHTFLGNGTGATYSNRVNGAFSATTYQSAWNLYLSMKNEHGLPINSVQGRRMRLLHGPANRNAVRTVLQQENIVGQTQTNLDKGTAEPVLTQWLTAGAQYTVNGVTVTATGTEWFLIPEGSTAIILQRKRGPEFMSVDTPNTEFVFRTGMYLYGIESEDGAVYGLPQEIVGGPGA